LGIEAVTGHNAGRKVFYQNVSSAYQVEYHFARLRVREVNRDSLLPSIEANVVGALVGSAVFKLAHRITNLVSLTRTFDLDHPSSEVC